MDPCHLKPKEYDISLTKNYITTNIQKVIHILILQIQ